MEVISTFVFLTRANNLLVVHYAASCVYPKYFCYSLWYIYPFLSYILYCYVLDYKEFHVFFLYCSNVLLNGISSCRAASSNKPRFIFSDAWFLFLNVIPVDAINTLQSSLVILSISCWLIKGLRLNTSMLLNTWSSFSLFFFHNLGTFTDSQISKLDSTFWSTWLVDWGFEALDWLIELLKHLIGWLSFYGYVTNEFEGNWTRGIWV